MSLTRPLKSVIVPPKEGMFIVWMLLFMAFNLSKVGYITSEKHLALLKCSYRYVKCSVVRARDQSPMFDDVQILEQTRSYRGGIHRRLVQNRRYCRYILNLLSFISSSKTFLNTNRPRTDHIPTTHRLHINHILTAYQRLIDHILATHQPHTDHAPTTYQPHTDCIPTPNRPHTDHIPTTHRPCTDYIPTPTRPHTDHIPEQAEFVFLLCKK